MMTDEYTMKEEQPFRAGEYWAEYESDESFGDLFDAVSHEEAAEKFAYYYEEQTGAQVYDIAVIVTDHKGVKKKVWVEKVYTRPVFRANTSMTKTI